MSFTHCVIINSHKESTNMSRIIMTIDTRPLARAIERSVRKTTCKPSFAMRVKKKFARKAKFFRGWSDQ
jgi:hypothetical protein